MAGIRRVPAHRLENVSGRGEATAPRFRCDLGRAHHLEPVDRGECFGGWIARAATLDLVSHRLRNDKLRRS